MKNFTKLGASMLMMSLMLMMSSCENGNDNGTDGSTEGTYTKTQFLAYTEGISYELSATATALSDAWTDGYSDEFKTSDAGDAVREMRDGMEAIANEVAAAKIGEPYVAGDVYGVESWYSFNSFTDYRDNLYSIQNVFFGKIISSTDAARATMSLPTTEESSLAYYATNKADVNNAINAALVAINDLIDGGKPFRDYVLAKASGTSSSEIENLISLVSEVEYAVAAISVSSISDSAAKAIVEQFVDSVVEPTYESLMDEAEELFALVETYCANPTQANIDAAADQWKITRRPWEQSEAFLFGPVDTEGYDPHLDSWPLSQSLINSILIQNVFPSNDEVGAIYRDEVLGFHAIEYVLFRAGSIRDIDELFDGDTVNIEATNEME